MNSNGKENYNWLSDDRYAHLKFTTRAHYAEILSGIRRWHGQAAEVDGAVEALMYITEQTWDIVRGRDRPIKQHPFASRYRDDRYSADE